ncbi:MAG: hypothetical protein ABSB14_13495 [Candidatus Sulfotelmatobacter sp.]|jgi:hypothetical protein
MLKGIACLLMGAALVGGYYFFQNRAATTSALADVQGQPTDAKPEGKEASKTEAAVGALAQWMEHQTQSQAPEERREAKPHPSDHIAESPVGTSSAIVKKTFAVSAAAKFPFEIPAHAASPRLHGTFHSFVRQAGSQSGDEDADVDLLLLNGEQYADFLRGQPAETVYSVGSSHDQDVSFGLPATLDHPVLYYLVFRNGSSGAAKKIVQADFQVDF